MSGNAFILVFSISSRQSLEELKPVLELINEVSELVRKWYESNYCVIIR